MLWAQVTVLVLLMLGILINASEHGKVETKKKNGVIGVIGAFVTFFLLLAAGAFDRIF